MSNIAIVAAARHYVGTAFIHQGRGVVGLDCLGLLMQVAKECDVRDRYGCLLQHYDRQDYSTSPMGDDFLCIMQRIFYAVSKDNMQAGDIVLCTIQHHFPNHCAIISDSVYDGFNMIHAYAPVGRVIEHVIDVRWARRIANVFRI